MSCGEVLQKQLWGSDTASFLIILVGFTARVTGETCVFVFPVKMQPQCQMYSGCNKWYKGSQDLKGWGRELGITFGLTLYVSDRSTSICTSLSCSPYPPSLLHHWPWPARKKGAPSLPRALWGNLGIIVVLIYPENPANPFFHLDVPEPKLLRYRDSAAPRLCRVTFFPLPSIHYSALLKQLWALGVFGFTAHTWQLSLELTWAASTRTIRLVMALLGHIDLLYVCFRATYCILLHCKGFSTQ